MKKWIQANTVIVAVCILTLALLVFPLSSFAKGGKGSKKGGGDSLICAFNGDIAGLVFDFGAGFTLDFGLFEATITSVEIQASGQETTLVIPPKQFIYNAILSAGWGGSDNGKLFANATLNYGDGNIEEDVTLGFEFGRVNLFEQFNMKKKDRPAACKDLLAVSVPQKLDLFFEVTNAQLIEPQWLSGYGNVPPLNLVLVIDKGKPVLIDTFEFLTMP